MPPVPVDVQAAQVPSLILLIVLATLVGISMLIALRIAVRRRTVLPMALMAGGLLAWLSEPIVDILGACWHPAIGQMTAFSFLERPMPVWLGFAYVWYFGAQTALAWYLLDQGRLRGRQLWGLWAAMVLSDVLLETVALRFDVWIYYGQQPLLFFKFPLWWAAPNSCAVILAAVLAHKLAPWLAGKWACAAILLPIGSYGFTSMAIGMPAFLAINTENVAPWLTQLAGIACFALDALLIALLVRLLLRPLPAPADAPRSAVVAGR